MGILVVLRAWRFLTGGLLPFLLLCPAVVPTVVNACEPACCQTARRLGRVSGLPSVVLLGLPLTEAGKTARRAVDLQRGCASRGKAGGPSAGVRQPSTVQKGRLAQ